ncbi:MAG TPA: hypothetical protein VGR10_07070 [Thermoleophilaceae bacterium]|nr:hypothetical protein [Thermoleophilaceae bacterium]
MECGSGLVHAVDWEEAGRDHWTVSLRCPNCEWMGSGTFCQSVVDSFDRKLDEGTQALIRDLGELTRANMAEDVARFVGALMAGAILPEDF